MVYQYFAQAPPEIHHLVRTCYLIVSLSPVRANVAHGIRVRPESRTESLHVQGLSRGAFFYFAFIFSFLTLYFKEYNLVGGTKLDHLDIGTYASATLAGNIVTVPLDSYFA